MNILHLTTELPHPSGVSGGSARQFQLLAGLARRGVGVTMVCPVSPQQRHRLAPADVLKEAGIQLIETRRRDRREVEAIAAAVKNPRLMPRTVTLPKHGLQTEMLSLYMGEAIARALADKPDVVMVEHDYAACLVDMVPNSFLKALTLQNVTPTYYRRRADESVGLARLVNRRASLLAERYIVPRLGLFDLLIAVSGKDAQRVQKLTDAPVAVIPNGTAAAQISPPEGDREGIGPVVLFTGTMNHPPNHEGLLWFYRTIWPRIVAAHTDARLMVVGRHPQKELLRLAQLDPRLEVTGAVPDMIPYYNEATVAVVPLRSGGGTRLKILDALASKIAVVTTTIGCEGLDVEDGEHLFIADEPNSFASRTSELLADGQLRVRISDAGRRLVLERYDWGVLADELETVLRDLVKRASAR